MHEGHYCWKKAWNNYLCGRETEGGTQRCGDGTDSQKERHYLDVGVIQAQDTDCFTRSDSPLCKHSLTVSKKKLDPKFNYLGTALHSWVLSHPRPRYSKFQKHEESSQDWLCTASALTDETEGSSSYCSSNCSGSGVWRTNPCNNILSQTLAVINWHCLDYSRNVSALSEMDLHRIARPKDK